MNLPQLYHSLSHTKPSQLLYRLYYRLENKAPLLRPGLKGQRLEREFQPVSNTIRDSWQKKSVLAPGKFSFIGEELELGDSWFPKGASDLFSFNLHYFDYLNEDSLSRDDKQGLIEKWIRSVPKQHAWAWHPYPTSLRICNWIWFLSRELEALEQDFIERVKNSLWLQVHDLKSHLEYDIRGNHLFENLKTLIIAGVFFKDELLIESGLRQLRTQLEEQFLSDGGHFEKCPMYHLILQEGLYAIAQALINSERELPECLLNTIQRSVRYSDIVFQGGNFPALNDSSEEIAPSWEQIREALEKVVSLAPARELQGSTLLENSGLFVHHSEKLSLYFDVGAIGPDYLPAHAHNDTLSLLLYHKGQPLLTDAGVYEYTEGQWRHYFRSAKAHNVLVVDEEEPNDIWKSFRVGYRGHPKNVLNPSSLTCSADDGSYKRIGAYWNRKVSIAEDESAVTVSDTVQNTKAVTRQIDIYFHFAPGTELLMSENSVKIVRSSEALELRVKSAAQVSLSETKSWYSAKFGEKVERSCLKISSELGAKETQKIETEFLLGN